MAKKLDKVLFTKKKIIRRLVDFIVPANKMLKLKKTEKPDKYLDLTKKLKNSDINSNRIPWNNNKNVYVLN